MRYPRRPALRQAFRLSERPAVLLPFVMMASFYVRNSYAKLNQRDTRWSALLSREEMSCSTLKKHAPVDSIVRWICRSYQGNAGDDNTRCSDWSKRDDCYTPERSAAMQVSEWMSKPVLTITPQESVREARERMLMYRVNQLLVVVDDKLIGIITDRDVREAYPSSVQEIRGKEVDTFSEAHGVTEVMTVQMITTSPQASIREAAKRMRKQRIGALPVLEEDKLVGIITRSDLLDAMLDAAAWDAAA